jgi:DNA polymerase V
MKDHSIYKADNTISLPLELSVSPIEAGFPSPADDHLDIALDLNEYLIKHPSATFYIYVKGDSMINDGIYNGDIMIVDRAISPKSKDVVIAVIDGEFTVKRIYKKNNKIYLQPSNKNYQTICITNEMDFQIWGVVTHTIHHCR